jgi:ABC-2 type transport system ATP-binding protein
VTVSEAPPVKARGLVKRYKEVLAVNHIDLNVGAGDVYGFLGPNGAGKTTTLRMCLGLIVPSAGKVELFGRDPMHAGAAALEGVAGFVEAPRFYPYLSGRKNLELLAGLDGGAGDGRRRAVEEVLDVVELAPRGKHRVGGYSHGMRQRLGIAAALLRRPRLLILDEPATGLDPAGMRDMRALIRRLAGEGITVLLSSHQLPEVQELCDRVAIVDSGRVVYEGALADLRRQGGAGYRLRTSDDTRALRIAAAASGVEHASAGEHGLSFQAQESDVGALSLALGAEGIAILALTPELATLEDLFFRLTEGDRGTVLEDLDGSPDAVPRQVARGDESALASAGSGRGAGEAR